MREALDDIRVIDLTKAMAGPYTTMMLGDMGAEVIKIEHPDGGDPTRNVPSSFHPDDDIRHFGGYFNSINRNKKSIAVDLKTAEGRAIVEKLVATADVVVENFRRGVPEKLGLSYEAMSEHNPEIVYASVSGYGDPRSGESPYANKPMYDVNAQALGGAQYITSNEVDGTPTKIGPGIGDIVPGMFAAFGVMTALWYRERTGTGQYVDVAMYDAIIALCERIIYRYSYRGDIEAPAGNHQPLFAPFGLFETADGHISIAATSEPMWRELCECMEKPGLCEDPRFETAGDRAENLEDLVEEIEEWTTQRTKEEVFDILSDDIPCGPVNDAADIVADEHVTARSMLETVEQPLGDGRSAAVEITNTPVKLTEAPGGIEHRAPDLGQHTEAILDELGFSSQAIERLYDDDIITPSPMSGARGF